MDIENKEDNIEDEKMHCDNCNRLLDENESFCQICNEKLEKEKINVATVPIVIMILISLIIGIFILWDIIFLDFSGKILKICEIDQNRSLKIENCDIITYREEVGMSYFIEIYSYKEKKGQRISFNEYPILFNKENYSRLFKNLKIGDYISKTYFSPYYIVNNETYVLIGSPLQIILFACVFIILIPIFLPKFIKDFIRDNKHLGRLR